MNKQLVIAGLILIGGGIAASCHVPPHAYEFNCEDDGKLVERQVDVSSAYQRQSNDEWRITYTDGEVAYYHQPEGETCFVVEIR
jgi:hypothetical protein